MEYRTTDYSTSGQTVGAIVYTIAEDGARTWREARDMYIDGGLVTAHANPDGTVTVFVGLSLAYSGSELFKGVVRGSAEFFAKVRRIATEYGIGQAELRQAENDAVGEVVIDVYESDATDAQIMDYALCVAFPVGYWFAVRDETGSTLATRRNVREARAYIEGWGDYDECKGLYIHPYKGNGDSITVGELSL